MYNLLEIHKKKKFTSAKCQYMKIGKEVVKNQNPHRNTKLAQQPIHEKETLPHHLLTKQPHVDPEAEPKYLS